MSPNVSYTWGKWEQNVIAFKEQFQMLSFAYKWVGDAVVVCETREGQKDDKKLLKKLKLIFEKADLLIGHNIDSFDVKKFNSRLIFHGILPSKIPPTVDTKKVAKKHFSFNSNSLDDLGEYLDLGRKMKHEGFSLWLKCMANDKSAWAKMAAYNKQDVYLLEKIYKKFLPWINNHPNLRMLDDEMYKNGCPKCGEHDNTQRKGLRANSRTLSQQWLCLSCGGWYLTPIRAIKET